MVGTLGDFIKRCHTYNCIDEETEFSDLILQNENLYASMLNDVTISESLIEDTDLSHSTLSECRLNDLEFTGGTDLTKVSITDSFIHRVVFRGCDLSDLNLIDSTLVDCRFIDCHGSIDVTESELHNVKFIGCNLSDSYSSDSIWADTIFDNCNCSRWIVNSKNKFHRSKFYRTILTDSNLAACKLEETVFDPTCFVNPFVRANGKKLTTISLNSYFPKETNSKLRAFLICSDVKEFERYSAGIRTI